MIQHVPRTSENGFRNWNDSTKTFPNHFAQTTFHDQKHVGKTRRKRTSAIVFIHQSNTSRRNAGTLAERHAGTFLSSRIFQGKETAVWNIIRIRNTIHPAGQILVKKRPGHPIRTMVQAANPSFTISVHPFSTHDVAKHHPPRRNKAETAGCRPHFHMRMNWRCALEWRQKTR